MTRRSRTAAAATESRSRTAERCPGDNKVVIAQAVGCRKLVLLLEIEGGVNRFGQGRLLVLE